MSASESTIEIKNLSVSDWEWIDVTTEGVVADGSADASADIESLAASNRLLVFPPGTYRIDSRVTIDGVTNFGMVAPQGNVTLTKGSSLSSGLRMFDIGLNTPVENFLWKGFDSDVTTTHFARVDGSGLVEDIELTQKITTEYNPFGVACPQEGRTLTLRNIRLPHGADYLDDTSMGDLSVGIYGRPIHAGTLRIEDCHVEQFPNNGVYASETGSDSNGNGRIIVEGGLYKNNGVAHVRVGGDGSVIRDVDFVNDAAPTGFESMRMARLRRGSNHLVENCNFTSTIGSDVVNSSPLQIHSDAGEVTVRDCAFQMDDGNMVMDIQTTSSENERAVISDCKVTGSGGTSVKSYAFYVRRSNTVFRDVICDMPNKWFAGHVDGADGLKIIRGKYDTDSSNEWSINSAADVDFRQAEQNTLSFENNGTRTRWNGTIGGGPLDGVDLSTTTGQYDGDRAVADGTSGASAGDEATWDADNGQWRVFQPSTTV